MNRRAWVVGALIGALLQLAAPAQAAPPSNDNFASAVDLGSAVPATATGSNIDATVEAGEPLARNGSEATGTIWWRWTAPETARYRVDVCATQPVFTATLGVFAGDNVAALTNVSAVGNGLTAAPLAYLGGKCANLDLPAMAFDAVAGTAYSIAVGGVGGSFHSNIALRLSRPAPNDNYANAIDLGSAVPAVGSGNNVDASVEANEPLTRDIFQASGTIWWKWTAPETARYRADICASSPILVGTLGSSSARASRR